MVGSVPLGDGFVPYAYYQFTQETAKEPPFICYYFTGDNDFGADNINYQAIRQAVVELYTNQKDFALESVVENILTANEMRYTKSELFIDSEQMHMTVYNMEVVING
jgi:hypothetical protein